ncbi:MAG: response regulator [Candidatus Sericytochromatia bacterium]|nr:response regulator [Candidatus Sericytochromatia bacterium]
MGRLLLLADPSTQHRRNLVAMLAGEGYDCVSVGDGVEAISAAIKQQPSMALIDYELGGLPGPLLAMAIRCNPFTSQMPVVMMSSKTTAEVLQATIESGASEFLPKPLDGKTLLQRLNRVAGDHHPLDTPMTLQLDDQSRTYNTVSRGQADEVLFIQRPAWGEQAGLAHGPGTEGELQYEDRDGMATRRRIVLLPEGEDPELLSVRLLSPPHRSQRQQRFRRASDLPLRYRVPGQFYRLATLGHLSALGLRLVGVHDGLGIGDEITMEIRNPPSLDPVVGKVRRIHKVAGAPIEADIDLPEDISPLWMVLLTIHLFRTDIKLANPTVPQPR